MTYKDLLMEYSEDTQHIKALISARGVKETDEVETDFYRVLAEEGYKMPWSDEFDIPVILDCGCETRWYEGAQLYPYVYAWCPKHGDAEVVKILA